MEGQGWKRNGQKKNVNVRSQKRLNVVQCRVRNRMKETQPIYHPMDRNANWCSGGLLVQSGQ